MSSKKKRNRKADKEEDSDEDWTPNKNKKEKKQDDEDDDEISSKKPKKKTKKITKTSLQKRLLAIPHRDLVATLGNFLSDHPDQETTFLSYLPVPSCEEYLSLLEKASSAISRALPHSRWGSSSDHYGYKRCSSAVTAFKKLWNQNISVLQGGDRATFLDYSLKALSTLDKSVTFDIESDNKYKELCRNALRRSVNKFSKQKDLSLDESKNLSEILESLNPKEDDQQQQLLPLQRVGLSSPTIDLSST